MTWRSVLAKQARRRMSAALFRNTLLCSSSSFSASPVSSPLPSCSRISPPIPSSLALLRSSSSSHGGNRSLLCGSAFLGALTLLYASQSSDNVAKAQAAPPPPARTTTSSTAMGGPVICKSGRIITKLKIFVGYDPREDLAFEVCRHSLLKNATFPIEVIPIKQADLRRSGMYSRDKDPTESTEFSFTRFLTPYLAGYDGWAMFVDCDFLYTADIRELAELIDDKYAIMCVQHDYTPKTATKMDGVVQTTYPRKNWSSMVLYNCSHPKNRVLTPAVVNSQSGAFLHRFMWLDDKDIGSIPFTWNFLVGHNEMPRGSHILPKAIHYTSGGPWFEAWQSCDYAQEWLQERDEYKRSHMIQKVIQSELIHLIDRQLTDRESKLEERVAELESRLKEVVALQRLLLLYLQERMILPTNGSGNGSSNGKEAPVLKSEDVAFLEERIASSRLFGKD